MKPGLLTEFEAKMEFPTFKWTYILQCSKFMLKEILLTDNVPICPV